MRASDAVRYDIVRSNSVVYGLWRESRLPLDAFIRKNRKAIDFHARAN